MKNIAKISLLVILALSILLIPGQLRANNDLEASIEIEKIEPDTLDINCQGKWIQCYIELPAGYDVADINVSSILLNGIVPAELKPAKICDRDKDGIPDLMVKFSRDLVQETLDLSDEEVITVTGELADMTLFKGIWPYIFVDIYDHQKACKGTTLLRDHLSPEGPRIIEVDMKGRIVWKYLIPQGMGTVSDVEWLPETNNILFVSTGTGVYEINRRGDIVWSYETDNVSHDADRLPNGNTIFAWGHPDTKEAAQVTEVNPEGEIVWSLRVVDVDDYDEMPGGDAGWTHTNAVTRMSNGNTLFSPRNFNFIIEVDPDGEFVREIGNGILFEQHDPEVLPDGHILLADQTGEDATYHSAMEIDPETNSVVWKFVIPNRANFPVRDANRLPNGNTLITGSTSIFEVTPDKEIVWRLSTTKKLGPELGGSGFYKAERICRPD